MIFGFLCPAIIVVFTLIKWWLFLTDTKTYHIQTVCLTKCCGKVCANKSFNSIIIPRIFFIWYLLTVILFHKIGHVHFLVHVILHISFYSQSMCVLMPTTFTFSAFGPRFTTDPFSILHHFGVFRLLVCK